MLEAGEGRSAVQIGHRVGCSANTAQKWRGRFEHDGLDGLKDLPRRGKPLVHDHAARARLIAKACTRPGPTESGQRRQRWTYGELAAEAGMSRSHAHAILREADVRPHLTEYWVMSELSPPSTPRRQRHRALRKGRYFRRSLRTLPSRSSTVTSRTPGTPARHTSASGGWPRANPAAE